MPNARANALRLAPFEPQLAQPGATPPLGDRWIHEQKFDGYRMVAQVSDGDVRIWTRNAVDWTAKLPSLVQALKELDLADGAFDGELVLGAGRPEDFNALQAALAAGKSNGLRFVLFDLLHVDGVDISASPLVERKALLNEVLGFSPPRVLAFSTHIAGHGQEVFEHARRARLEGIVSKRADAPYRPGRGSGWQKTKNVDSEEFAAVGFTRTRGQRSGFRSLLLARPTKTGWRYAGRVGTGFSQEQLRGISRRIADLGGREPTAEVPNGVADLKDALWFPPLFVVDAFSRGIGSSGVLRHASLKDVRLDKSPEDLRPKTDGAAGEAKHTGRAVRATKVIRADLEPGIATNGRKRTAPSRLINVIVPDQKPAGASTREARKPAASRDSATSARTGAAAKRSVTKSRRSPSR